MSSQGSRAQLLERVRLAAPRLVVLAAAPGWGKTHFARELVAATPQSSLMSFRGVKNAEEGRSVVERALGGATWDASPLEVAVFDDADELLEAGGEAFLIETLETLPAHRMLVMIMQATHQLPLSRFFAPHEILTLGRDDLLLTRDECREAIAQAYMPTATLDRALDLASGWPIGTFLLARLAREGRLEEALADTASSALGDLHSYMQARMFDPRLSAAEKNVIIACAALRSASAEEISAATGADARPVIEELLRRRVRYLHVRDGMYSLAELTDGAVRALYPKEVRQALMGAACVLSSGGKQVRAAFFAARAQDFEAAARFLDLAGRRAAGEPVSAQYQAVAEILPLELILSSKNIYLEYFCNRRTRARPYQLFERVRAFCDAMNPDVDPFVRFSARVALTTVLRMTHRGREAETVAIECESIAAQFPAAQDRRALLRSEHAIILAFLGRIEDAAALWREFDAQESPGAAWFAFSNFETVWPQRLQTGDAAGLADLMDRNVEHAKVWNDPAALAQSLAVQVISWATLGPVGSATKIVGDIEKIIADFMFEEHAAEFIARFARPFDPNTQFPTHVACLLSVEAALAQTDRDVAERLLQNAIQGFDAIGHPYWQIAGRLAASQVPGFDRDGLIRECLEISRGMQVPAITGQLEALLRREYPHGPYSTFMTLVDSTSFIGRSTVFRIRLLDARVVRGGADVRLRNREFEVLAHLALAGCPVSAEVLCEAIWPDSDEAAAVSALRMSIHRLRKQLGDPGAVVSIASGYQLGPQISVDILEAESAFTALRRLPALTANDRTSLQALFHYVSSAAGTSNERESWYEKISRRVEDLRQGVGMLLAREYLRLGEPLSALEIGETLLRFDSLDEAAVGLCVQAIAATGDKIAALRYWQQYVKRLAVDYGAKPSVALGDLVTVET